MIKFDDVKLNIGNTNVLSNLNFEIEKNKITLLVGDKNSGKTAILYILTKIYTNYEGIVTIDDVLLKDYDKKIGIVFKEREKNIKMPLYFYLQFYAAIAKIDEKEMNDIINTLLEYFAMMPYKFADVDLLDAENYNIVQLIRVLLLNPDIILFDDVFISNDKEYVDKVLKFIKKIKGSKTLVFANRDLRYLEEISDYIGIVDDGRMLVFDEKSKIYEKINLNKKVELKVLGQIDNAITLLKKEEKVHSLVFDDDTIIMALDGDENDEMILLKKLVASGVQVYSFKKENISFEELYSKIRDL